MVVCQEGYIEISPGVYAPKVGPAPLKPRKPFAFEDLSSVPVRTSCYLSSSVLPRFCDTSLQTEMGNVFMSMLTAGSHTIPRSLLEKSVAW
jgi:hypothetical protein